MPDFPEAETDIRPEWLAESDGATPRSLVPQPKSEFVPNDA